jgi:hypothetical protein
VVFRGHDQTGAEAAVLAGGIDRQESKVTALSSEFGIYATRQSFILIEQNEFALLKQRSQFLGIGAVGINEESLGPESGIHQGRDGLDVGAKRIAGEFINTAFYRTWNKEFCGVRVKSLVRLTAAAVGQIAQHDCIRRALKLLVDFWRRHGRLDAQRLPKLFAHFRIARHYLHVEPKEMPHLVDYRFQDIQRFHL